MGLSVAFESETRPKFADDVADLTGVAKGSRIKFIVYFDPGEPSGKILLVHFFAASTRRLTGRMSPGNLGVVLYSHRCGDLDGLHARMADAGYEIVTAPTTLATPGNARRVLLVRGPNEELFEFHQPA